MNKLKGVLYDMVLYAASSGTRSKAMPRKILVVRVDEIGDYMLWRSFISDICNAPAYQGFQIHFCGNQSWRTIFNALDADGFSNVFWLDKIRFKKNLLYRYRFLKMIFREGYDTVINPTFSRDKRYDDSIVAAARAQHRIGMIANTESVQPYERGYDAALYTRLFDHPEKPLFEWYRNQLFTAVVTGSPPASKNTRIDIRRLPPFETPGTTYFVVFPGSRSRSRIWPASSFQRVASFLSENYGWTAVVCGTTADKEYTDAFFGGYKHACIDMTGRTSLTDMLRLFAGATCLLSVDTGSVHLAAASGCTVFGVFNGSQYGRFAPYPKALADNFYAVYPDDVEADIMNAETLKAKYEFVVNVPYSSVPAEKVISAVMHHFGKMK